MTDLILYAEVGAAVIGALIVNFGLSNFYMKEALNKAQRTQVLEQLFKQLNIKDFKVTDLNMSKLDDKGFMRLMAMLQMLFASKTQTPAGFANLAAIQAQVNEFVTGLRQMQQINAGTQGQPTTP